MILAVASGKGGTGKTTVAVSLALANGESAKLPTLFLDCDVEAPNAALFFKPKILQRHEVGTLVPEILPDKCNLCGICGEVCAFHAMIVTDKQVMIFPDLCHGCGNCTLNCPTSAIQEHLHVTGTIEEGWVGEVKFAQGKLAVGEALAPPIIHQLKKQMLPSNSSYQLVILDAPPGTACPLIETVRGSDFVLMVTEPTPFGLHDLRKAVDVVSGELGIPVGVVVNRDGIGDVVIDDYCAEKGIPILLRIPYDRKIAEAYSDGFPLVAAQPDYRRKFKNLYHKITRMVKSCNNLPS
jgi:MinD superfamily P-loop ATPase